MIPNTALRKLFCFLVLFFGLLLFGTAPAQAQRLVFQTGNALYTASADGKDPRRLLSFGTTLPVAWAISPDGRRIVYATYAAQAKQAEPIAGAGLLSRPLSLRLTDIVGRHVKPLAQTDLLRDRQGKRILLAGIPTSDLPPLLGEDPLPGRDNLDSYQLQGLTFSADSRTLYLACTYSLPMFGGTPYTVRFPATFALDAATGTPLVDGQGRWKSLAPVAPIEARGGLLAGIGVGFVTGGEPYSPLFAVNLVEGTRQQLFTLPALAAPASDPAAAPPRPAYAQVRDLALAPENRAIALTAGPDGSGGLWRTDKFGKTYERLMQGTVRRPRFSPDGTQLYLLLPRPGATGDKIPQDLYVMPFEADLVGGDDLAPTPVLVRQNVDWFDLVPE